LVLTIELLPSLRS